MEGKKFSEIWNNSNLVKYDKEMLHKGKVSPKVCEILSKYGLPQNAAPYLNFECMHMDELEEGYFYLGYTGNGDFICLNTLTENIIIIDHEMYYDKEEYYDDEGDDDEEIYEGEDYEYEGYTLMNTGIDKLYDFIVLYYEFMQRRVKNGGRYSKIEIDRLKTEFEFCDKDALLVDDCFWNQEILLLERNRESLQ